MAVTINANVSTNQETITLGTYIKEETATVLGTPYTLTDDGQKLIAEYESQGYTFNGEADCTLHFQLREVTCDYEAKSTEINGYLDQGYTITDETNCSITLEKTGTTAVVINLDSTTKITDEIKVDGSIATAEGDQVIVEGTPTTTEDEQVILDLGYIYEGVIDGRKTWKRDISYFEYDNKLKTIADYQRRGYTFLGEQEGSLRFTGVFEECEIENKLKVISDHKKEGYTLISESDCMLVLQREIKSISNETDVYAFFDTTSMRVDDGVEANKALNKWFESYQQENPDHKGNLYILPIMYERYIDYLDVIKKGNGVIRSGYNAIYTSSTWGSIGIFPDKFDSTTTNTVNPDWTPPTDVLMLAFVDESQGGGYHGRSVNFNGQPTTEFTSDYNKFLTNKGDFNFFKGVLYPIVRNLTGAGGSLVLQGLAAIEGKTLSSTEISAVKTKVDISPIKIENPYQHLTPLKKLGWVGVYDKTSPASEVFTSSNFSNELNKIITSGSEANVQVEEKTISGIIKEVEKNVNVDGYPKTITEYVYQDGCEIKLSNTEYFKDASFTIGYSTTTGAWLSYYSFIPNYFVNHNDYFQTGLNEGVGGLWDHLKTNKSFQTFYGETYPWILDIPVKEQLVNRTLKDVSYYIDAKEYSSDYDQAEVRNRGFNKACIYNNRVNSGELHLKPSTGLMSDLSLYPNTLSETEQEIPYSDFRGKHRFNYFYDRVENDRSTNPMWNWDVNQIHKDLNPGAISFTGKPTLDQIKGDWFSVRFQQDERTDTRFEFKWMATSETIKP